jgi:hypothetical protein
MVFVPIFDVLRAALSVHGLAQYIFLSEQIADEEGKPVRALRIRAEAYLAKDSKKNHVACPVPVYSSSTIAYPDLPTGAPVVLGHSMECSSTHCRGFFLYWARSLWSANVEVTEVGHHGIESSFCHLHPRYYFLSNRGIFNGHTAKSIVRDPAIAKVKSIGASYLRSSRRTVKILWNGVNYKRTSVAQILIL